SRAARTARARAAQGRRRVDGDQLRAEQAAVPRAASRRRPVPRGPRARKRRGGRGRGAGSAQRKRRGGGRREAVARRGVSRPVLGMSDDSGSAKKSAGGGAPPWLEWIQRWERTIGEPVEAFVSSDAYFDLMTHFNRARARATRTFEGMWEE